MKKLMLVILIYLLCITGYVLCVVKLCRCDFKEPYKAEVLYGIGACTGLGAIIGWLDFEK